jgi:hypothetical protein
MPKQFDESSPLYRSASLHNVVTKHPRLVIGADQILGSHNVVEQSTLQTSSVRRIRLWSSIYENESKPSLWSVPLYGFGEN